MVFKGAKLLKNSRFVTKDNWFKVVGCITKARVILVCTVSKLRDFADSSRTPNKVALWQNSAAKK